MPDEAPDAGAAEAPVDVPAPAADPAALEAAAAEATPTPPAPATEPEIDLDAEPADDVYADPAKAKALVESLRKEAAKNRVKAKEASAWKEGWTPDDAAVLEDVIRTAAADPKVGAAKMREIADLLDKGDVEGAAEVAAEASADAGKVLTESDVEAKVAEALAQRDKAAELERATQEIVAKCKELGYDPSVPEQAADYFTLIHIAKTETEGDLDKAHEKIQARNQAIVDAYVADVQARAEGTPLHAPRPDLPVVEPKARDLSWKGASDKVAQRIANSKKTAQA